GAVGSFHCEMCGPCLRSFAYSSALRYALDATATPWTPTEMRAPFIMRNICGMPWFSTVPTSSPTQPSLSPKLSTHVEEPFMPSLCSRLPTVTSVGPPSDPASFTRTLGTMKSERPLVPGGAPSTRARTRWTMFSARSWSPPEMKTFVPRIEYLLPSILVAVVRDAPTSDPACGSVKHIVPPQTTPYSFLG